MPGSRWIATSLMAASLSLAVRADSSSRGAEDSRPLRGVLVESSKATAESLRAWKAEGGNAVVVPLDESVTRQDWAALGAVARDVGIELYAWIEVARNPNLAAEHPSWMASPGGHHDDWRRRFPNVPGAKPGESLKLWPWVPIGYAPAFDEHRARLESLLDGLGNDWTGVFLNDLQCGPSACGCGNDQCRWTLDYGSTSTAAKLPGDDAAARLVAGLLRRYPGKSVIPVWVTECEAVDLPKAVGGTGHCGSVPCAQGACWPNYARTWVPLTRATPGPIAVGLWHENFRRPPEWVETGLGLFLRPPKSLPLAPERAIAVVSGWGDASSLADWQGRIDEARGGILIARSRIDQSWEPRVVTISRPSP